MMRFLVMLVFASLLLSCTRDDPQEQIKPYVGTYSVDGTAINGVMQLYDSSGYYNGPGYDTILLVMESVEIRFKGNTDTLLIDGLLYSWYLNHPRQQVQGVLEDGVINIIYDESSSAFNEKITGTVNIQDNQISMDYVWDRSNVWSGVPPTIGMITAAGQKVN